MTVAQQIEQFIIDEIMVGEADTALDYDESLLQRGVLDSLSLLRLISFIEDRFQVNIDEDEIVTDNFETINTAARMVESKL